MISSWNNTILRPSSRSHEYKTYLEATLPLVEYYQNHGILHKIDASLTIDEVNKKITSIINKGDSND